MHASNHAVCTVHQKGNGTVVNFNPLSSVEMTQKSAKCEKDMTFIGLAHHFNDQWNFVNKHHGPRTVFRHFQKCPVDVQVDGKVRLQPLQKRCDVFAANGASLPYVPLSGHASRCLAGDIILRHGGIDEGFVPPHGMAMWCTIRTFAKHALELGNQPAVEPIVFVKPAACLLEEGPIPVSQHPGEVHHEVECVVRLGEGMLPEAVAVGLDLTDRATQSDLRAEQLPWAKAKCFRGSAVVGSWHPWEGSWPSLVSTEHGLHLSLWVNGDLRQSSPLHEMSVTPAQQMEAITAWAPVQVGDLLFTGTPQGVGELLPDDLVEAKLTDGNGNILSEITVRCD